MLQEVELAFILTFSFCFLAAAIFAIHFIIEIFSEAASLKRGLSKRNELTSLNFAKVASNANRHHHHWFHHNKKYHR